MTLPASGALTVSGIRTELGASGQINLGGAGARGLSGIASGAIRLSDFHGKSNAPSGGLWLWGANWGGQLGDNTIVSKSSPIQTVCGGTNWSQVASGGGGTTAAIKTDGTLWVCGYNTTGQLGDNTRVHKSSPIQTVAGGTNWKQVSSGGAGNTAAIKTDGTLWLWGYDGYGVLGDNSTANKSSPIQTVAGGTNWKVVALGSGGQTAAAIKTDGTLWLWGRGDMGQLGDNTVVNKSSPVQTVAGGTDWSQVSLGQSSSAAIKTDGTLWTWGYNVYGQLGDNTVVRRSSPVQTVAGGTNWKQVAAGFNHIAAIKTDGTLWVCGYNNRGQLGINSIVNKSSPVQTVCGGTNWSQVSAGRDHTAAIKTDGTLWLWGRGIDGQLGDNTVVNRSSPIQTVAGGTNWKVVACSNYETLALR